MVFVGRKQEQQLLHAARASKRAELVILYGRRRIGKSALLKRVANRKGDLYFEALQQTTKTKQINHFLEQLSIQTGSPISAAGDWPEALDALTYHIAKGTHFVVLDEFPWMASGKTELVSLLKYYWDNKWKQNSGLTLVVCGSIASFMIRHIVHSQALHNRKTIEIKLEPLLAKEAKGFFQGMRSDFEVAKFLMIFGGVPKYLELLDPAKSLADNIDKLCFLRHGFFLTELETVFKEQFKVVKNYERIVRALSQKSMNKNNLSKTLDFPDGGGLTTYLSALEQADFIRTFSTSRLQGRSGKTNRIVLWDDWLRFYFTWVEPHRSVIELNERSGLFDQLVSPGLSAYLGLAFERFCMKNLNTIFEALEIDFHQIRSFGPFFRQSPRSRKKGEGLQIDILVRRTGDVLTLIECKFSSNPVGVSIIDDVERKIKLLKVSRRTTVERVLICPETTSGLLSRGYFHRIAGLGAVLGD